MTVSSTVLPIESASEQSLPVPVTPTMTDSVDMLDIKPEQISLKGGPLPSKGARVEKVAISHPPVAAITSIDKKPT